jgi:hypothetical protein
MHQVQIPIAVEIDEIEALPPLAGAGEAPSDLFDVPGGPRRGAGRRARRQYDRLQSRQARDPEDSTRARAESARSRCP